jgi:hypothetical protein
MHVADEVKSVIVLGGLTLLRNDRLWSRKAVVRMTDTFAITNGEAFHVCVHETSEAELRIMIRKEAPVTTESRHLYKHLFIES